MSTGWTPEPAHDDTPPLPYTEPYTEPYGGPSGAPAGSPTPAPPGSPTPAPSGSPTPAPSGAGVPGVVGAPPPYAALPPYTASSFGPAGGPPPRRGLSAWAIVGIVVGSFLAVMILAAIAVPVFLNQREAAVGRPGAAPVNFDRFGCADLATGAVRFSRDLEYPGDPLLTSVENLVLFEDERADLQVPVMGEYEFVMSCTGTGTWEDGSVAPLVLELLMDADGIGLVNYGLQ